MSNPKEKAYNEFEGFEESFNSVVLGTVNADNFPHSSYAPFVRDEQKNLYFFLSGLTQHTNNLENNGKVSILFLEPESEAKEIFARKRLTYEATSTLLERDSKDWNLTCTLFKERFGNIISQFQSMPDFRIFKAVPSKGRFVFGFGAAYDVTGKNLDQLEQAKGGGGHGHGSPHGSPHGKKSEGPSEPLDDNSSQRIMGHMNNGHGESLIKYAKEYGKVESVTSATMTTLDTDGMNLEIVASGTTRDIRIQFENKIETAQEAHHLQVKMARE